MRLCKNWCAPAKRRRIYARDGFMCAWCRTDLAVGRADLDHLNGRGAGNSAENLVSSCAACNMLRATMPHDSFRLYLAGREALRSGVATGALPAGSLAITWSPGDIVSSVLPELTAADYARAEFIRARSNNHGPIEAF